MTSAHLFSIQSLSDLRGAFLRFNREAQEALQAVEAEIQRTMEWLSERATFWQNQVRIRQEQVARAQAALARCQAAGHYDPQTGHTVVPNCSSFEYDLVQARVRIREAEDEYRKVQEWARLIQQALAGYQLQAHRLQDMCANELPKATALLERKVTILQAYVCLQLLTSFAGSFTPISVDFQSTDFQAAPAETLRSNLSQSLEYVCLDEALAAGHSLLSRYAGLLKPCDAGLISWDGSQIHFWEFGDIQSRSQSLAPDQQQMLLEHLTTDPNQREAIIRALEAQRIIWHISPPEAQVTENGPALPTVDAPGSNQIPSGSTEYREGSPGGPERYG